MLKLVGGEKQSVISAGVMNAGTEEISTLSHALI